MNMIKITTIRLALACIVALNSMAVSAQEESFTLSINLEKAIDIALSENPTVRVADKDIELKKVADTEAWQSLLPQADITGSMTHTLLAAEMKLNNNTFKMGRDGTTTGNTALAISFPVFAPAVYRTMKLTKADIGLALEKARANKLSLVNQVTKAYYQALLAKDSYNVMQQSYNTAKENYDVVKAKFDYGAVSEYDALSAEVQMRSMKASLTSAQSALNIANLQLKVLMGITMKADLSIDDRLENYRDKLALENGPLNSDILANNSTMRQFDINENMLNLNRKILKANFIPTVNFSWTFQYQSLYNKNWNIIDYDWSPSSNFLISFNIPLFHASNWTKLKSNKIQQMQLADNRINTERQLLMAVDSYRNNMTSSVSQVESNSRAVEQAEKAQMISAKRYEVGRGTIIELNQSETALTQAKLTYNQSIFDYLTNKADLEYTLGNEQYLK